MVKIRCKRTGDVYNAEEVFSHKNVIQSSRFVYGEISEEEFIVRHNKYVNAVSSTNSTVKLWDETSPEEKERLIKMRFRSTVGTEQFDIEMSQYFIGYFVESKTGGNMDKGWVKVFDPKTVEVIDA